MSKHQFLFQAQNWVGEGTIILNMVEEELNFSTRWNVLGKDNAGKIQSIQELQIAGISENMRNALTFFDFGEKGFSVEMENINIGKVLGTGIYDDKIVSWEFRDNDMNFEGFEVYRLLDDNTYTVHAEYVTSDQFRTEIRGKIWLPPEGKIEKKDK